MNIDGLKKKIQEANPEIMELKFGCEVKVKTRPLENVYVTAGVDYDDGRFTDYHYCYNKHDGFEKHTNFHKDDLVSLGRPIRLADVLVTLEINNVEVDVHCFVNQISELESYKHLEKNVLRIRRVMVANWKLLDDNLDHQSEATKEFLTSLLV